jgi:hypothetical protein
MKKFYFLFLLLFAFNRFLFAQYQVIGSVLNGTNGLALGGATVFINGGSNGTVTDKDGNFVLSNISSIGFELVVSYVSFETIVIKISAENIHKRFKIQMAPKENLLQEVVVGAVEKDGWKKWGKLFTDHFIGTSSNAANCTLTNPNVLRFRYNKKNQVLTVSANDQLIIINNALGYVVKYQLEEFTYDSKRRLVTFLGYSSFKEMEGNKRKMERWVNNRKEAFYGSMMHFMRSVYAGKAEHEGYNMTSLIRYFPKDSTTRRIYDNIMKGNYSEVDTANYSIQITKPEGVIFSQPVIFLIGKKPLYAQSIRKTDTANHVFTYFENSIQLVYTKEFERPEYVTQMSPTRKQRGPQTSIIYLTNSRPVTIEKNGLFFEPLDVFTEGYLAWEKMGEMLPTDYSPAN